MRRMEKRRRARAARRQEIKNFLLSLAASLLAAIIAKLIGL